MNSNEERYFDFSTDDKDWEAFQPGAGTDPALKIVGKEIQRYLLIKTNAFARLHGRCAYFAQQEI